MATIQLLTLDREAWEKVADDPDAFAVEHALTLGVEPAVLRMVGQQAVAMLERTRSAPPWTGYLGVDGSHQIIGTCAFRHRLTPMASWLPEGNASTQILEKLGFERVIGPRRHVRLARASTQ